MGIAMHGMETRMLLGHYSKGGESKAEPARRLGVSRRTIHSWVESGQLDRDVEAARYSPAASGGAQAGTRTRGIDERLSAYPKLRAQLLFEELRTVGYTGGYSRMRYYVREARPRVPAEPFGLASRRQRLAGRWTWASSVCRGIAGGRQNYGILACMAMVLRPLEHQPSTETTVDKSVTRSECIEYAVAVTRLLR